MTAEQFWEWMAHNELRPFTQAHEDRRIALLAEVVGKSAGLKMKDGGPLTMGRFLDILSGHATSEPVVSQSVEQMTELLNMWITGSNAVIKEEAAVHGR